MADGFALRGFTQGFTQGLQNIDQLATNWQARDLKQKGYELEQQQQERANRYNDYLIKNMERTADRQDRQDALSAETHGLEVETKRFKNQELQAEADARQRQNELNQLWQSISSAKFDDNTMNLAQKYGINSLAEFEPEDYRTAQELIRSGVSPDDPRVSPLVTRVINPAAKRMLGSVGSLRNEYTVAPGAEPSTAPNALKDAVPKAGQKVMIANKDVVKLVPVGDGYVPMLRVQGAVTGEDGKGQYVEYEAPFTQMGLSDPKDPIVKFTKEGLVNRLGAGEAFSSLVRENPALKERLLGQVQQLSAGIPKQADPLTQSRISKIEFEKQKMQFDAEIKAKELQLKNADGNTKAALAQELADLRRAQTSFTQAQERALGMRTAQGAAPGLGSARSTRPAKPFELDRNVAKMWIDKFAPLPKIDPLTALPEDKKAFADAQNRQTAILADLTRAARMTRDMGLNATTDELVTAIAKNDLREMQVKGTNKYMRGYWLDGSFYPIQSYTREPEKPKKKSDPALQPPPGKDDFDMPTEKDIGAAIEQKYPTQPQAKGPALRDFTRGRS